MEQRHSIRASIRSWTASLNTVLVLEQQKILHNLIISDKCFNIDDSRRGQEEHCILRIKTIIRDNIQLTKTDKQKESKDIQQL